MSLTNFPKPGDNKAVSLRNSSFARCDIAYAESIGKLHGAGAQHAILCRVARHGGTAKTRAEEKAVRLREAWAAKNYKGSDRESVIAQFSWLVVGEQGEAAMKNAMEKNDGRATGGAASGASGGGEARDAGAGPERRAGDAGASPVYLQRAVVRSVRREGRPTGTNPDRKVVVVDFVASTEIEDSHETIIRSNWNLTRYTANPVLLWMHGRMNDLPAIGNVEQIKRTGTHHEGVAVFDDTTQFDRDVADKYEKGVLKGFSIGFYPNTVQFERIDGEDVLVLDDIELLEISCVNVPSNPEALARSQGTGWDRTIATMSYDLRAYEALHARAMQARAVAQSRGAIPYTAYPTAEGEWDAAAAEKRIRTWATTDGKVDFAKYGKAFAWVDPEKKDTEGGYKLPHHDVRDGTLVTVKAGVIAAGGALQGARGGVKIPDGDVESVKSHLSKHYSQFGLTPPWEKADKNHGETQMKTVEIQERDIRASSKGVQCEAACPNCKEAMMVKMDHVPMPTEKAAEIEALNTRAVTAEKKITEEQARAAEIAAKLTSAETRAATFETQLQETRALVVQTRVDGAKAALEARSGKKVLPAEIESEMELARMYLADLTPDATDKTRTVGEVKWAKRLSVLDARPEMQLLAPPASAGATGEKPREEDPTVRDAANGTPPVKDNKAAEDALSYLRAQSNNRPAPTPGMAG